LKSVIEIFLLKKPLYFEIQILSLMGQGEQKNIKDIFKHFYHSKKESIALSHLNSLLTFFKQQTAQTIIPKIAAEN